MANLDKVKTKIQGLIDTANSVTGNSDKDLTAAVNALASKAESGSEDLTAELAAQAEVIAQLEEAVADKAAVKENTDIEDSFVTRTLIEYINNRAKDIGAYAFYNYESLISVDFPVCTSIGSYAFDNCTSLTSISFPNCETIGVDAFKGCSSLTSISFPVCINIRGNAFDNCTSLTSISFPNCETIGVNAFYRCSSLTSINFPNCENIGNYAFGYCTSLTSVNFPACKTIELYVFSNCTSLTSVSFPNCTIIGREAFYNCSSLTSVNFPVCTTIGNDAFAYCYNLLSLYLRASIVCTLSNSNAFVLTPIGGYTTSTGGVYGSIFVPASLVDAYKAATNWTYFTDRIAAIPEDE